VGSVDISLLAVLVGIDAEGDLGLPSTVRGAGW
jgi:hypothetical protein